MVFSEIENQRPLFAKSVWQKPHLREPTRIENSFIPRFFSQKAVVLYAKNDGFIGKKRRFHLQETTVLENDSCFCKYQKHLLR
ncbi:MAG: hypothetical protein ACTTIF_02800 [Prevotella sp.]